MNWIDEILGCAQKLGSLSAAAIFAFICIAQGYYIYKTQKDSTDSNEKWRLTREGAIRAEESQTQMMSKMVDVISMNTTTANANGIKIDRLSTILEERVPRKV